MFYGVNLLKIRILERVNPTRGRLCTKSWRIGQEQALRKEGAIAACCTLRAGQRKISNDGLKEGSIGNRKAVAAGIDQPLVRLRLNAAIAKVHELQTLTRTSNLQVDRNGMILGVRVKWCPMRLRPVELF